MLEKEPDTKLRISVREDAVCRNCPNNVEGSCKSHDKVMAALTGHRQKLYKEFDI